MIAVALLAAHPGNVPRDLALDEEFVASVRELGILTPLPVTPDGGGYRVIDGHRRLAAAGEAGLAEVPCDIAAERAGDEPVQFLDM
jgi:ParB family chromosome partitioning protein